MSSSAVNVPILSLILGRDQRRRDRNPTGAVIEAWIGKRAITVTVCRDHVLRVRRGDLTAITGLPEDELETLPTELGVTELRPLLMCIRLSPETLRAAQLVSALIGELQEHQGRLNLDAMAVRPMIAEAGERTVLRPLPRRLASS
jgi:hypothetical protein